MKYHQRVTNAGGHVLGLVEPPREEPKRFQVPEDSGWRVGHPRPRARGFPVDEPLSNLEPSSGAHAAEIIKLQRR